MEGLADLTPFVQLGASGVLLGIVVWIIRALVRGDWVPRRELDYVREDRNARVTEARQESADWRAAHETSEKARELLTEQNRNLIAGLRVVDQFFDALRAVAERGRDVR